LNIGCGLADHVNDESGLGEQRADTASRSDEVLLVIIPTRQLYGLAQNAYSCVSQRLASGGHDLRNIGLVAAALALVAASCAPIANYDDPGAQIGRSSATVAASQYKTLTLAVVFTDNTKKAMDVVTGTRQRLTSLGPLTNQSAVEEADPAYLAQAIDETLRRRFKDVLILDSAADRHKAGVDAVMFLDVQIVMGTLSFTQTKIAVQGIFVDEAQNPIAQVKGDGAGTIPWPAFNYAFKPAASQAIQRFAQSLDGATDLAAKLTTPASVVAVAPTLPPPVPAPALTETVDGKRVALVVGNAAYRNVARLGNTTTDARVMGAVLRQAGFELVGGGPMIDLDHDGFIKAIRAFGTRLLGSKVAVFYYAGHGLQMQGVNYLVPIDANPEKPSDADSELVDATQVLHQMDDSGASLKVVILDACRNSPFGGRGLRGVSGGLAQMHAPEGTVISYATQPGNVARDGPPGGDSPYTVALAKAMTTRGLDVLAMFNEVGVLVDSATGGDQQPWLASSPIKGRFYFGGS
jgi:hypothetical protein